MPYKVEPLSVKLPKGFSPFAPLNVNRLWNPLPSVFKEKTVPSLLAAAHVVMPYNVEPLSVKLP